VILDEDADMGLLAADMGLLDADMGLLDADMGRLDADTGRLDAEVGLEAPADGDRDVGLDIGLVGPRSARDPNVGLVDTRRPERREPALSTSRTLCFAK
jgi:hypothetical protein